MALHVGYRVSGDLHVCGTVLRPAQCVGGDDDTIDPNKAYGSGSLPASNSGLRYSSAPHDDRIGGDRRYEQGGNDDRGAMVAGNGGGEEQHRA